MCNLSKVRIRQETDEDCHWERQRSKKQANCPLNTINVGDAKCSTTNEDDCYLSTNHNAVDTNEEEVALQTLEDIEFVVQTTVVELVEDLHPDKGVEDHGVKLEFLDWVGGVISKDLFTGEVQDEYYHELEDGLADDHFPHVHGNERDFLAFRLAVKNFGGWGVGGEGKGSKGVHDEVHPKKLDSCEDGVHVWVGDS